MNDRELLELAAKAAGAEWTDYSDCTPDHWEMQGPDKVWRRWSPLTDDGDALRLAVKLRIEFYEGAGDGPEAWAGYYRKGDARQKFVSEPHGKDPFAATRRAIVRAAAAIGEAMP